MKHITKQLKSAAKLAEENKSCIAIGHVGISGKRTATALKNSIPVLKDTIKFVGVSELIKELPNWAPKPGAVN